MTMQDSQGNLHGSDGKFTEKPLPAGTDLDNETGGYGFNNPKLEKEFEKLLDTPTPEGRIYVDYRDAIEDEKTLSAIIRGKNTDGEKLEDTIYDLGNMLHDNYLTSGESDMDLYNSYEWSDDFLQAAAESSGYADAEKLKWAGDDNCGRTISNYIYETTGQTCEEWDITPYPDVTNAIEQIMNQTPNKLASIELSSNEIYDEVVNLDYEEPDDPDFFEEDDNYRKREFITRSLKRAGIDNIDKETLDTLVSEGPYSFHDGCSVDVLYQANIGDLYAKRSQGATPTAKFNKNLDIVFVDHFNGSGIDVTIPIEGTKTFSLDEDKGYTTRLDRDDERGYGWDEIAGVVTGYYNEPDID